MITLYHNVPFHNIIRQNLAKIDISHKSYIKILFDTTNNSAIFEMW